MYGLRQDEAVAPRLPFLCGLLGSLLIYGATPSLAQAPPKVFPGTDWERVEKPETVGYSGARLEALRVWLRTYKTTGLLVVVNGKVLFEYGDVKRVCWVASVRKSVLAMLYGKYVIDGTIDPNKTVKQIGLDDVGGLLPAEQSATLEHLMTSRSGIYHEAANDILRSNPPRGSQVPGYYYLYNNWDFNAAGTAFEKLTGKNIYDELETQLARPTGMQDFDRARQKKQYAPERSVHPAYHMWLSTRDMARLGLLMLRGGEWQGKQLISADWVRYITSVVTPHRELNPPELRELSEPTRWGYGVMWWVWDGPQQYGGLTRGPFHGAYSAKGSGGQFITVLPALDMVIAHTVEDDYLHPTARGVTETEFTAILEMLIAARCSGDCARSSTATDR